MKHSKSRFLSKEEFSKWDEFVDKSPQGNIFNKTFWLESVCEKFEILVYEENKQIIGGIVLPQSYSGFYRNPTLTPQLGVLLPLNKSNVKYNTALTKEFSIINDIIDNLPKFKQFDYNFSYNFKNFMPFIWKDFKTTVRYTYIIDDLTNSENIFNNFDSETKRYIKKSEKANITVSCDYSIKDFYEVNKKTYDRQGMKIPYSLEFLQNLDEKLAANNSRKMFFALDGEKIIAAIYLIYDKNCTYYLMGGTDPEYKNTGAQSFLLWHGIQFAGTVSNKFDFEGSMIKGIEHFFRGFGAKQTIIHNVHKSDKITELMYSFAKKNKKIIRKFLRV